mmetsp:Transcript_19551/g.35486  ORF Transcript_19551/g.35486 Transcript_19551/m.35486 type:complete len:757 (-) Transcript_19551:36-2306(-)|eukprot:CAMPEP_0196131336 /NCGR_PEP_ID=MMETSP0910-20130528/1388_1 /TAXON_ID=49265 /ORGANISM="Thalassiosira rotula, Strain GSO102" /LENGTH=756 /DNA_ID=CAMNT_0041390801 /DNA_START=97 /DNA_END=2367 /DNA_ORIENTATION=-
MGCSQSTSSGHAPKSASVGRRASVNPPMTKREIHQRIDCIDETRSAKFGGVSVRYAYLSQRGYYPDDAHKANQDSYAVTHDFADRKTDAFFGVFDGHGRDGDKCAHFVRDNFGPMLKKGVIKARVELARSQGEPVEGVELSKEKIQEVLLKAHTECNRSLHMSQRVDDSLSGTTSISVYLHGNRNRITISNVGDSRAVIGRVAGNSNNNNADNNNNNNNSDAGGATPPPTTSGALKAFALSRDQTPYRRDERVRIRKTGARILSLDQIEGLEPIDNGEAERDEKLEREGGEGDGELILGDEIDEGGDPPRVWSPHGDYPGTAFTRSFGDAIAEELGVISKPEMLMRELTPEDKIIVLASDGVFEFLTNQSVIDICAKFTDPLEACRAVVAESYELWLQYELRTDDITMICIFVDGVDRQWCSLVDGEIEGTPVTCEEENDDDLVDTSQRPVRKGLSVEKSRALMKLKTQYQIKDVTDDSEEDFDITSLYNEKTEEQKASIAEAIRASVVFQNITDAQRELIYKVMEPMEVKAGQWIIKQGTVGDRFYIVDEGSFEVRILAENEKDEAGDGGNRVHSYEGSRKNNSHPSFGELALMYSAPRAASIIAQTDGHLWALHRYAYKKITEEKLGARKDSEKILKKIDVFKSFTEEELSDLSAYLYETKYGKGDTIIKEGKVGDSVFIVLPGGSCESVRTGEDGTLAKSTLEINDFFGEEILKGGIESKYLSTVTAKSKSTFLTLQKSDVKRVMGSKQSKMA